MGRAQLFLCVVLGIASVLVAIGVGPATRSTPEPIPAEARVTTNAAGQCEVLIDGQPAPEREANAIRAWFTEVVSRAVVSAVQKGLENLQKALQADDIDMAIFKALDQHDFRDRGDNHHASIHLFRTGPGTPATRTVEILNEPGKTTRMSRTTGPYPKALALANFIQLKDGHVAVREVILEYDDARNEWRLVPNTAVPLDRE